MIELRGITFRYDDRTVLDDVDEGDETFGDESELMND